MRIPLFGKATDAERLELHMEMNRMNPKGFPTPPTSKKNRRTHSKHPATTIERLAAIVYKDTP